MIEGHGNNIYQHADIEYDFSSNVAFNNRADEVVEHLQGSLDLIKNYPDTTATTLRERLAARHSVKANQVMVANGSCEAFYMVAHMFMGGRTLILTPSFAEYEDGCRLFGHKLSFEPIERFNSLDLSSYDTVWIATPNNPDGYCTSMESIAKKARQHPMCHIVIDRAYCELSLDKQRSVAIEENIIIIDSLTKSFGIPGLRLGYLIASESVVSRLENMRPPWSVNALALSAGEYILDNYSRLQPSIDELITESQMLQQKIALLDGFEVTPSNCNFFLCKITSGESAAELQKYLIENDKILIRDCSNFRSLTESHFRVAALGRAENDILIKALKRWRLTTL